MKRSSEERITFWQSHVEQLAESKQSRQAYCRANNLNPHTFKYWQERLHKNPKKESSFIPLKTAEDEHAFQITLPNGFAIHCHSGMNLHWIKNLAGILQG